MSAALLWERIYNAQLAKEAEAVRPEGCYFSPIKALATF
jgi:hypothetical protein